MPNHRQSIQDIRGLLSKTENTRPWISPVDLTLQFPRPKRSQFRTSSWGFALVCLTLAGLMTLPLYLASVQSSSKQILGSATSAYDQMIQARTNLADQEFAQAEVLFERAIASLEMAQTNLADLKPWNSLLPDAQKVQQALTGAYFLSLSGERLAGSLRLLETVTIDSAGLDDGEFGQTFVNHHQGLQDSYRLLQQAQAQLADLSELPATYQQQIAEVMEDIARLDDILAYLLDLEEIYLSVFGKGSRTYLLVFQNYDEQRATGGFIGTYGTLQVEDHQVTRMVIDSVYDLDGRLTKLVAAPGPFQPAIEAWGLRDGNWFADFALSAQKLLAFYEQSQETADGVLAFTPKLFEDLLRLTGPIYMDSYEVWLTAENFQAVVQEQVSVSYDRVRNEPKQFLADFAPILLNRLPALRHNWLGFLEILADNLERRQVLLYSKDPDLQAAIERRNFGGRILPTDGDYLAVINSNLGGTKTDLEMSQAVTLTTRILSDGAVVNLLKISRQNKAAEANRNYLRVLVPLRAELISATGLEEGAHWQSRADGLPQDPDLAAWDEGTLLWDRVFVRTESGKTEFAFWNTTAPNSRSEVTLLYRLPLIVQRGWFDAGAGTYSMLVQKQSGSQPYQFRQVLQFGEQQLAWLSPNAAGGEEITFGSASNRDDYWAAVFN